MEISGNWIHGRCAKIKRLTNGLAIGFICRKCKGYHKNIDSHKEKLHDDVETVTEFLYLGDIINSGGGCVATVTSRTILGWMKFREFQDLFFGKVKGIAYKSCLRSAMLYVSETWSLGQNEIGILQRTDKAMERNMCGMKLMDKKFTRDLMQTLDLNETIDQPEKANSVR